MTTKCHDLLSLFVDDAPRDKKSRKVARLRPHREASQVHLPIFGAEDRELIACEEIAASQRPLARADCQAEARPCPWVACSQHLFNGRFELYERLIDSIECKPGEKIVDALARRIGEDGWPVGVRERDDGAIEFERINLVDKSGAVLRGPLPTCALDVAEQVAKGAVGDGELSNEDVARLTGQTREGVRVLIARVGPEFARAESLRPWLLEVASSEAIASLAGVDFFGED